MAFRQCIFTKNECYQRGTRITPKGVMIHSTGANNKWLCRYVGPNDGRLGDNLYGNHWNQSGIYVCVHGFIGCLDNGNIDFYQTLPFNIRGWHCGGEANDTHISIEICEDNLENVDYFRKTRDKAIEVVTEMCMQYGFNPLKDGVLIDHSDGARRGIASNHGDVEHWWGRFGYSMSKFRKDVAARIEKIKHDKEVEELKMAKEEIKKLVAEETRKIPGMVSERVTKEFNDRLPRAVRSEFEANMSAWGTKDSHHNYSAEAVKWAVESGLMKGKEGGNFGWEKPMTREEFATVMFRYKEMMEK